MASESWSYDPANKRHADITAWLNDPANNKSEITRAALQMYKDFGQELKVEKIVEQIRLLGILPDVLNLLVELRAEVAALREKVDQLESVSRKDGQEKSALDNIEEARAAMSQMENFD